MNYRCYFFGFSGHFVGSHAFDAKDDEEALILARRLYAIYAESVRWAYGLELWQRGRLVHTEPKA